MARHNELGNSFLSLDLDKLEEEKLKSLLKTKGWSGKQYLRLLVRKDLGITPKIKIK